MIELLAGLKRRKLVQWALAYVAFAFALIQVIDVVAQRFGWPAGIERIIILALAAGFVAVLVIAWYHGEKGRQRVSGPELLLIALVLAIGGVVVWRFGRPAPPRATARVAATAHAATGAPDSAAAAVASGLRVASAATQTVPIPAKSVAVLPFANLSGDPKQAYFSDGITVEILNALAQIPKLKVAGRTSAFAFKGRQENTREIGQVLGVATVLEGSVQKAGDEVRVTVQLVDTRSGYQLWSENYDRKLTNIFAIEDEISNAVASKLRVQLVGGGGQPLIRQTTVDPDAHALYLRAVADIARRGPALKDAVLLLQQATGRDPRYANAWGALSQAYELLPYYGLGKWRSSSAEAEQAAKRALALDPQSGEAHAALANVLRDRLDYAAAEHEYRKALALSPGSSEIHNQFAQLMHGVGASRQVFEQERIAVSLDPLAPSPRFVMGLELMVQRRYPQAISVFEKVLQQTPDYASARFQLAFANLSSGHYDVARQIMREAELQLGKKPGTVDVLMRAYADPALRPAALRLVPGVGRAALVQLGGLAEAFWYGLLNAREPAITSLQRWAASAPPGERFVGIPLLRSPAFDPIRNDPRFKAVLKKMGLPYKPKGAAGP